MARLAGSHEAVIVATPRTVATITRVGTSNGVTPKSSLERN
jgi:hypothetical protein